MDIENFLFLDILFERMHEITFFGSSNSQKKYITVVLQFQFCFNKILRSFSRGGLESSFRRIVLCFLTLSPSAVASVSAAFWC